MNGPSFGWLAPAASMLTDEPTASVPPNVSASPSPPPPTPPAPAPNPGGLTVTPLGPANADPFGLGLAPHPDVQTAPPATPTQNEPVPFMHGLASAFVEPSTAGPPPAPAPAPQQMPPAPPPAASTASTPEPPPQDVQFMRVGGGGVVPSHEAYMRGPQQDAHLMQSFEPGAQAAVVNDARIQDQAAREEQHYAALADQAMARQQGIEQALVRRQQQLDDAMQSYQDSIKQLGAMHLDTDRWWANKSTGDKIGTAALVFLSGLGSGLGHGPNLAYDAINKKINDDIDAQKFDYQVGLERAKGAQNSFAMLVQKFGSEDAAEAAARAAALDYAQAKTAQLASQWKGVDSANQATALIAQLEAEKQRTIANGFKFVPAQTAAPRYAVAVRGQVLPGTVSEAQAQNIALEHGVKPSEEVDKEMVKGGIAATIEQQKLAAQERAKQGEAIVHGPFGDYVARNPAEAAKHDEEIRAAREVIQTVDRLKELREKLGTTGRTLSAVAKAADANDNTLVGKASYGVGAGFLQKIASGLQPEDAKRAETEAKALLGAINREQHFGALDKGAQEVLTDMIGNPNAVFTGNESKLDELRRSAMKKLEVLHESATGTAPSKAAAPGDRTGFAQLPSSARYPKPGERIDWAELKRNAPTGGRK